ncbi:MAG TPA: type II secretion system F family protein [Lentisphaeria bacterium]|nr:type II secretion system F family protein [Lentisphaerota bacterium]OQC16748.1 MAG: Type II secretion system protein F [Lentisphaerae bacterium ADurb.Bin082]HQC53558.1 type II secretion system F family protein [Lentisphaeria bacterium]HQL85982.1 type II secretion system F family protein [Lentisphaeria bacterium]
MARFQYTAMDSNGKERKGSVEAENEQEATQQLKQMGLFPTSLVAGKSAASTKGAGKAGGAKTGAGFRLGAPKIPRKDLTTTTRQLATLLEAGLPLVRALRTLERQAKGNKPALHKVLGDLATQVESGATFSEALAAHPRSFNKLYVSMVRAGEASGAMEVVLVRLAEFMEKAQRIAGKVKSAMMYPISVLVIAGGITAGLMIFIVPKFAKMFDEMLPGEPMPAITQFVVNASNALANHALVVLGGLAVFVVVFKLILKTKPGALAFDTLAIKCPPFNALVVRNASARFCRTLGTLMSSGVAVLQALQIVKDTSGNELVSRAIQDVHDAVKEGEGMTKPLEQSRVFPLMLCSMVEVGEETGALPDMLNRVAGVYEEEVDRAVEGLTAMIEPLMICFLAVVVGGIVIAMFAPMVKMIDKLGG